VRYFSHKTKEKILL